MRHTDDMGEISGLGGSREETCQQMLEAGIQWLKDHPEAVVNINANPTGADYKQMVATMVKQAPVDTTLAQYNAVAQRLTFVARYGWDAYCIACRRTSARRLAEMSEQQRHAKTLLTMPEEERGG